MARQKKDGTYLNVRIKTPLYKKVESVCEDTGLMKTALVEKALEAYFEDYDRKQALLRKLDGDKISK